MGRIYDFIGNTADGVFAVDGQQAIVLWNEKATDILGFDAAEVLGRKCYGVVCGRDIEGCVVCRRGCDAIAAAKQLEPSPTADIKSRTKEGEDVWLNLSSVVVPSHRGELSVLVHLFREVTRDHDVLSVARDFAGVVSGEAPSKRVRGPRTRRADETAVRLTRREREVLAFLASGMSTDWIAKKLRISPRTVRNHVNNILKKLDVHSRLEAVTFSIHNGLV